MRQRDFRALVLQASGQPVLQLMQTDALAERDLRVQVRYSGINYKDALAVTGAAKIIRGEYPFIPGIDLVGTVRESGVNQFNPGDQVILTGGGLGESVWGGYAELQSIDSHFVVRLPDRMSARTSMILGTAGLTAMLSVMALQEHGVTRGEIIVTGASGGVGLIAVYLLTQLGYDVMASCGSRHLDHKLSALGAKGIIGRMTADPDRLLHRGRWDGAVDAAGGPSLSALLPQIRHHGCVAASGNAAGAALQTTVYPFILRGVTLAGIDSNTAAPKNREAAWDRLTDLISAEAAEMMVMSTVTLDDIPSVCRAKLAGQAPGRFLVDVGIPSL
ncbi:MAG: acryloyl-CoA reductase [Bacteroidota bacterium]|nr:acryloyl-CoA reductase [Bacteroidota bacterium]